jgi:hypothetical protein
MNNLIVCSFGNRGGKHSMIFQITEKTKCVDIIKAYNQYNPYIMNNNIIKYTKLYFFGKEIPHNCEIIKMYSFELFKQFKRNACISCYNLAFKSMGLTQPEFYIGGIDHIITGNNIKISDIGNEPHNIDLLRLLMGNDSIFNQKIEVLLNTFN